MALQSDITTKAGLPMPKAYTRVKALRFDHPDRVYIELGSYVDGKAATPGETKEYNKTVKDFGGKENINAATAYALIKQEDEWKDATDV